MMSILPTEKELLEQAKLVNRLFREIISSDGHPSWGFTPEVEGRFIETAMACARDLVFASEYTVHFFNRKEIHNHSSAYYPPVKRESRHPRYGGS